MAQVEDTVAPDVIEKPDTADSTDKTHGGQWSEVSISDVNSPAVEQSATGGSADGETEDKSDQKDIPKMGDDIVHTVQEVGILPPVLQGDSGPPDDTDSLTVQAEKSIEQAAQEYDAEGHPENTNNPTAVPTVEVENTERTESQEHEVRQQRAPSFRDRELPPLPPQSPSATGNIPLPMTRDGDNSSNARPASSHSSSVQKGHRITSGALTVGRTTGSTTSGQPTISSMVFVVQALESIGAHKESRKRKELKDLVDKALDAIKAEAPYPPADPTVIFEPLHSACETKNPQLMNTALDCIGKLISFSYFSLPSNDLAMPSTADSTAEEGSKTVAEPSSKPLIERAIETVWNCFEGDTPSDQVQLQIIKALLNAVLNEKLIVHGAALLKAIRMTYNIFLLSKSSANQATAQGTLTQMVHTVFERVKTRLARKEALYGKTESNPDEGANISSPSNPDLPAEEGENASVPANSENENTPKTLERITLQSFENRKSFDDDRITDNSPTTLTKGGSNNQSNGNEDHTQFDEDEVFIRDAFLVFRAMCKLSIKNLPLDQSADMRSHDMRSKLLSLYLIHTILKTHMTVFINPLCTIRSSASSEPTPLIQAVKQYLCLSLSRNAASAVSQVFEVCCEIFWLIICDMRFLLKSEIEVFLKEIYLAILDNRNSSARQKQYLIGILDRLCSDPRALVELYLNYDCDRSALENIYQRIIEHLSKITITPVHVTEAQQQHFREHHRHQSTGNHNALSLPPSLSIATIATPPQAQEQQFPIEYQLKQQSLHAIVEVLRSLVRWSEKGMTDVSRLEDSHRDSSITRDSVETPGLQTHTNTLAPNTPNTELDRKSFASSFENLADDPSELESAKRRKTELTEAIRMFNYKPKRGIKLLLKSGFIKDNEPKSIAEFLLDNTALSKAAIGEYLGEGDEENIKIMHAFVDLMDFNRMRFVDALRGFLQKFRLPGEAQKIDRLMLKFAERYISDNPNAFANADTAYVLSYSVIMLNTDLHSDKLKGKARMTKEEFIRNNRGINDKEDLPDEYLIGIYNEILSNEIVLETERTASALAAMATQNTGGIAATVGQALAGRDIQKELYVQASEEMANKTEQLFRSLLKAQRRNSSKPLPSKFIAASSFRHVGPMFEVTWMSFLSALSAVTQDPTAEIDTISICMEGFRLAIRIACLFDLETPRTAFVSALAKFTHLNNISEMKPKHIEALKVLLEIAQSEGNLLKSSWRDVLTCVSQLERFQLISSGVDEGAVPDVTIGRYLSADNSDARSRSSIHTIRTKTSRSGTTSYLPDVAQETRSTEITLAIDRIFSNSAHLNGEAIIHFVRALSEVSWQEIQSSGDSENPRMFCLQKLVEISYYNMNRIRVEWSSLWSILGEHFNQVGCHSNTSVVYFALDSLRQLSMKFLEKDELPHFRFQKDFLKPFEYVISNNNVVMVKDMVLRCLNQMVQARGDHIKSGWRTMFGVFTAAAGEGYDSLVAFAFENVKKIYKERFSVIISQGAFADMVVCLTAFAKNHKFQKISLQAIEILRAVVPKMLACPECPLYQPPEGSGEPSTPLVRTSKEDPMAKFWFPILFAFHDILMTGEDLEVRTRALNCLFDTLVKYGGGFPPDFWDTVCKNLLFPIFLVLKSKSEMQHFNNNEAVGMWLSTTMIQALRNLISLFTHYFDQLERMLDGFLDLLITCICQENDTIARIGSSCLQQLILQSVKKLRAEHWSKIVTAFVQLFEATTADQLFTAADPTNRPMSNSISDDARSVMGTANGASEENENDLRINGLTSPATPAEKEAQANAEKPADEKNPAKLEEFRRAEIQQQPVVTAARRRFFNRIITKCVLQLLMIETVSELFSNDAVYNEIPSNELLRLMALLKKSFTFARRFNGDKELRMKLWQQGFMKQPPNLLKQESNSAATYVSILFRMYHDERRERMESREDIEEALIPLCFDIIRGYVTLDEETQQRNILAWRPVVVDVLEGYSSFPREDFDRHVETFYPLAVEILGRDVTSEVRGALRGLLRRVGEVRGLGI